MGQDMIGYNHTVSTHNKHVFVRSKKVCLFWKMCLFWENGLFREVEDFATKV